METGATGAPAGQGGSVAIGLAAGPGGAGQAAGLQGAAMAGEGVPMPATDAGAGGDENRNRGGFVLADAMTSAGVQPTGSGRVLPAPALQARGVGCDFVTPTGWFSRRRHEVLRDVSLTIPAGTTLGIVGESGSGKTTLALALLRLAAGEVRGEIEINGRRIDTLSERDLRAQRIGEDADDT